MAKGLCCAAQAAGDLGKPIVIVVHKKDGSTTERCGTCEIVPSCRNQTVKVFAFRFLASADCGLAAAKCKPSAAGEAQYNLERARASSGLEREAYTPVYSNGTSRITGVRPLRAIPGRPYMLPPE
jgi:hypothetical protein